MTEQYRQYSENSLENGFLNQINVDDYQNDNSTTENISKKTEENENNDLIKKIIDKSPVDPFITIDLNAIQDEIVMPPNINVNGENDINGKEKGN